MLTIILTTLSTIGAFIIALAIIKVIDGLLEKYTDNSISAPAIAVILLVAYCIYRLWMTIYGILS